MSRRRGLGRGLADLIPAASRSPLGAWLDLCEGCAREKRERRNPRYLVTPAGEKEPIKVCGPCRDALRDNRKAGPG